MKNRAAGILLSISSLPGKYGIGSFSKEAYKFVDFLKALSKKIRDLTKLYARL